MGWEFSEVIRFDLEPPPSRSNEDSQNLKVLKTCLLLMLEVCNVNPTCRISWAGNLLMLDLTLGPSFKVKRWFEVSFPWIQICIGSHLFL